MTQKSIQNAANQLVASLEMYSTALLAASHLTPEGNTEDPRDLPVRLVLKRCADFGKGCAALGNDNNPTSLAILARAILENLILILWVTKSEENAKELQDAAIAELKRAARINLERGKAKIMNRVTGEDATEKILADDQFKKLPKRKSVEARAGEAGVEDLYHIFYRFLSLDTHGHELNLAEGKNALDLAVMHMQGIGALLKATGHAGTIWLQARKRMDNETLRSMLGL